MKVTTGIEVAGTELELEADVLPGSRPTRDDPGAGAEINWTRAYRIEGLGEKARRVPIADADLDALQRIVGDEEWRAIEESLIETASEAEAEDAPDPDEDDAFDSLGEDWP